MFFRFAALLLSVTSFATAIEVSMIDMQDVMENHRIVTDSSDPNTASPYAVAGNKGARGVSFIKSNLKKLLMKTANVSFMEMDPSEWHEIQTTYLTGTSNFHQDHKDCEMVEEEVGFVALNTNNDAYFDHPDMKVPIREGAFIRFKGSEPHRTVVNTGNVHLLGPFDLKSFGKVGEDGVFCCFEGSCFEDTSAISSECEVGPTFPSLAECDCSSTARVFCCSDRGCFEDTSGASECEVPPTFTSLAECDTFCSPSDVPTGSPSWRTTTSPTEAPSVSPTGAKAGGKAGKAPKATTGGAKGYGDKVGKGTKA